MSLEAQTKQQQGREKPNCLPSTLGNMSGCPRRVSLGGMALAASCCTAAFGDTSYFTVHGSTPCI